MQRLFCLSLVLTLAACSTTPPLVEPDRTTPDEYPYHTIDQIRQAVSVSTGAVRSYSADGSIEIVTPERQDDASHSLRSRLADSTTAKVRGPLGIEVARALVTPDSFLVYNRFAGELLVGRVSVANRYVPGTGSSELMARAMVGLLAPDGAAWTVTPRDGEYVLVARRSDGSRRVLIVDPSIWRVTQAQEIDADNTVVADQTFSEFDTIEGIVMPRRVVLTAPLEGLRLTMEHRRLTPNPTDLRLQFSRPEGADVVPIR